MRIRTVLLVPTAVAVALSLAGCGHTTPAASTTPVVTPVVSPSVTPTVAPSVSPSVSPSDAPSPSASA